MFGIDTCVHVRGKCRFKEFLFVNFVTQHFMISLLMKIVHKIKCRLTVHVLFVQHPRFLPQMRANNKAGCLDSQSECLLRRITRIVAGPSNLLVQVTPLSLTWHQPEYVIS